MLSSISQGETTVANLTEQQKFQLVMGAENLNEQELGEYLRRHGIYSSELKEWKKDMLDALVGGDISNNKERQLNKKISNLEKELNEAKVLLEMKKKVQRLLGEEE